MKAGSIKSRMDSDILEQGTWSPKLTRDILSPFSCGPQNCSDYAAKARSCDNWCPSHVLQQYLSRHEEQHGHEAGGNWLSDRSIIAA